MRWYCWHCLIVHNGGKGENLALRCEQDGLAISNLLSWFLIGVLVREMACSQNGIQRIINLDMKSSIFMVVFSKSEWCHDYKLYSLFYCQISTLFISLCGKNGDNSWAFFGLEKEVKVEKLALVSAHISDREVSQKLASVCAQTEVNQKLATIMHTSVTE